MGRGMLQTRRGRHVVVLPRRLLLRGVYAVWRLLRWKADVFCRVLFPGALNSEFTNTMEFMQPAQAQAISTYRVMNQYGEIIDKEIGVETTDEEALVIYKNMVKRQ